MTLKTVQQQPAATPAEAAKTTSLLDVIAHGSGDELLSLRDLKASGSHPFSNSTRRRKIACNEYPTPIKVSSQMCLWKVRDIRLWRQNPKEFKQASIQGRG